jgi:hypothetical protein
MPGDEQMWGERAVSRLAGEDVIGGTGHGQADCGRRRSEGTHGFG